MRKLVYLWSKDTEIKNIKIAKRDDELIIIFDEDEIKENKKGELIKHTYTTIVQVNQPKEVNND